MYQKKKTNQGPEPGLPTLCPLTRLVLSVLFWAQKSTQKCGAQGAIKYTFRAGVYNSRGSPALRQIKRLLRPKAYFISGSKGPQKQKRKEAVSAFAFAMVVAVAVIVAVVVAVYPAL